MNNTLSLHPESQQRYHNDPEFRLLVDTLHSMIDRNQYTPGELRMACHEACVQYESRRIRPAVYFRADEPLKPL
jgi:hypothetical protein